VGDFYYWLIMLVNNSGNDNLSQSSVIGVYCYNVCWRIRCRKQVSGVVWVDCSKDLSATDARACAHLPVSLAAPSQTAAASTLQHTRLPHDALLETVWPCHRQGLVGRHGGTVWTPAAAPQPHCVVVWMHHHSDVWHDRCGRRLAVCGTSSAVFR